MTDQTAFKLAVVAPVLPITDMARSLAYYTGPLMFTVGFEWTEGEAGQIDYAIIQQGDVELHLARAPAPRKTAAYVFVDKVDAFFAAVQAKGAQIAHAIADQPWEMREFEVIDPDGNALIFGEHLSRLKPAH